MKRLKQALLLLLTMLVINPIQAKKQLEPQTTALAKKHGLFFKKLPTCWDEAIPLGNGIMGTLVWKKGDNLRLALDRADLWDLRPVKEFSGPNYTFKFICDAVTNKNMKLSLIHI